MLSLPKTTEFNKRIPKQKFYENLPVTPALKRSFVEQIHHIYWRNKLAVTTLNLTAGDTVTEIEVFEVRLNAPQLDEAVLRQIDKEIPYHILFVLTFEGKAQAWIGYKEATVSGGNAFKVSRCGNTGWIPENELQFRVDGLSMDAVYENLVRQTAENALQADSGESSQASVVRDEKRRQLEKQISTLENKMRKEKQLNRRVEMNAEYKKTKESIGGVSIMKVKPWDKKLWEEYYAILSVISVIASLVFLFIDIPDKCKICCLIAFFIILVVTFLAMLYRANKLKKVSLKINNSTLEIEAGDIFSEQGFKIIAFNDFFDTQVDDVLISKNTLNGKYITQYYPCPADLDAIIDLDIHSKECIIDTCQRNIGKTKRYKLGTIIKNREFFLLAFTHFDKDNRAFLEINDYTACLMNMWNECDIHYGGNTVVLPLLGSGITRFRGYENITDQELLEIIIWTFKVSRIRFQYPAKAKIVLTDSCLDKISLYDVKKRFES